jgi:prophage regulatory protein
MQPNAQSVNPDRLLRASDVTRRLVISDATLWRLIQRGEFPKPIKFGRSSRWSERGVEAWLAARTPQVA